MPMVTAPQDVRDLGDEFKDVSDARIGVYLAIAESMIAPAAWGATAYHTALKLLAAHLLSSAIAEGAAAPVKSMTVGQTTVSYGTTATERDGLARTEYGEMYMQLMQAHIVSILVL